MSSFQSSSAHRHSAAGSNSSNPFRSHSRENLPSFDDCFAGFNDRLRLSQLGERHISAPSPQQWQPHHAAPLNSLTPTSKILLMQRQQGLESADRLQQLSSVMAGAGPSRHAGGGISQFSPSVLAPAAAGGIGSGNVDDRDPADFSYRTLPVSDRGSSDDDENNNGEAAGTPPRPIERSPGHPSTASTPMISHRGDNHTTPGRSGGGGLDTPLNKKPPLHPNVSPIFSPSRAAGHREVVFDRVEYGNGSLEGLQAENVFRGSDDASVGNSERRRPGGNEGDHLNNPARSSAAASSATRPPTTLDEAIVSQLFPLFSQFLRSLPPQHIEQLLLSGSPSLDRASTRRGLNYPPHECMYFAGNDLDLACGTPAQLAELIIPSADLLAAECGTRLGDREFSYYRPHSRGPLGHGTAASMDQYRNGSRRRVNSARRGRLEVSSSSLATW